MLLPTISRSINELNYLLVQLSDAEYAKPCEALSNATIGEHTRHVIEMFLCLLDSYDAGIVNYDRRERNLLMQTQVASALTALESIRLHLDKKDKAMILQQAVDGEEIRIASNYFRELLYNLEHCIHHQALIKVALKDYGHLKINTDFGVAHSTIEYRNQCAR
ncbi:MAG TPA: DinB family protein [Flavobacterium sp.]|jgi:hypothetical protein